MSLRTSIALPLLLAACTARPLEDGDSATDATTGDTTTTGATTLPGTSASTLPDPATGPETTVPATTDPPDTTSGDPTTGADTHHDFIIPPDWQHGGKACDTWTQDCPEGQKCMPYSGDGDNSWESLKCVDIVPDPGAMYEPCTAGPIDTGEDSCDKGLMCWNVVDGVGQCLGMCIGSPDFPACEDPQAACLISGDGVLTLCLPGCDPLLQDCHGDDLCIPNPQDPNRWLCVLDASGDEGQAFDVCEFVNACDQGLVCATPEFAEECDPMQIGCCLPFCDTSLPNTCPGVGQECLPWYEEGQAPPGFENVGLCGLPMP